MSMPTPIIGDWYLDKDGGLFEVVAVDADDQTIEVQHFDGALEEFDREEWLALAPQPAEAPEDWTGPLDLDAEDHDDEEEVEFTSTPAWLGTGRLDRDEVSGFSEVPQR